MNPKPSLSACLLCCLAILVVGCSAIGKSGKKTSPVEQPKASAVEWRDRKWESYGKDPVGVTYFFDKESVTYPSKGMIHVWRKKVLPRSSTGLKEIIAFDEINCRAEKYRSLEVQGTNSDGSSTEVFKKPSPWTTIYADSADEYFLDNFCPEALKAPRADGPGVP